MSGWWDWWVPHGVSDPVRTGRFLRAWAERDWATVNMMDSAFLTSLGVVRGRGRSPPSTARGPDGAEDLRLPTGVAGIFPQGFPVLTDAACSDMARDIVEGRVSAVPSEIPPRVAERMDAIRRGSSGPAPSWEDTCSPVTVTVHDTDGTYRDATVSQTAMATETVATPGRGGTGRDHRRATPSDAPRVMARGPFTALRGFLLDGPSYGEVTVGPGAGPLSALLGGPFGVTSVLVRGTGMAVVHRIGDLATSPVTALEASGRALVRGPALVVRPDGDRLASLTDGDIRDLEGATVMVSDGARVSVALVVSDGGSD